MSKKTYLVCDICGNKRHKYVNFHRFTKRLDYHAVLGGLHKYKTKFDICQHCLDFIQEKMSEKEDEING